MRTGSHSQRLQQVRIPDVEAGVAAAAVFEQLQQEFGLTPIINAGGANTAHSGSRMSACSAGTSIQTIQK
jgi:hypothetical protein